jgi:hypothetical protein
MADTWDDVGINYHKWIEDSVVTFTHEMIFRICDIILC